ncbi:MAG: QueT transporter family protein [Clostridia bacterium]|nr:QueT transporter family protein [Clostridia bacterium]
MKSKKQVLWLTQAAIIAALYAVLTITQSLIAPGTASMAVQFRVSEAMTLLCCITPAAIPGLTLGCFLANFLYLSTLPWDWFLGSLATLFAGLAMYALRNIQWKKLPLPAALMPAVFNGIIIGLEIEIFFIEGPFHFASFLVQAGCVALGELVVCFALGLPLYKALDRPQVRGFLKS